MGGKFHFHASSEHFFIIIFHVEVWPCHNATIFKVVLCLLASTAAAGSIHRVRQGKILRRNATYIDYFDRPPVRNAASLLENLFS